MTTASNMTISSKNKVLLLKNLFYKFNILLGQDFGFFFPKNKIGRKFIKCFCLLYAFVINVLILILIYIKARSLFITFFVNLLYCGYQSIILITTKNEWTFHRLELRLKNIDAKLGAGTALDFVERRKTFSLYFLYMHRIVWAVYYCNVNSCMAPTWLLTLLFLLTMTKFTMVTIYGNMFYSMHHRVLFMANALREVKSGSAKFRMIYKEIVHVTETFTNTYVSLFFFTLLTAVPEMMFSLYNFVKEVKEFNGPMTMHVFRMETFAELVKVAVTVSPAVFASRLASQVEELNLVLHDKLLFEYDAASNYELRKFIAYTRAHPLKFTVYRVIPLDLNLLKVVLNFSVNYLIVLIQVTHLY